MLPRWQPIATFLSRCVPPLAARLRTATADPHALLLALLFVSRPVRAHLRQPLHVHRRALALFFGVHRLQQIERLREIVLNRLLRGREVQPPDFGELVIRAEHLQFGAHRRFRRSRERNASNGRVFSTSSRWSQARRAMMTPQFRTLKASLE